MGTIFYFDFLLLSKYSNRTYQKMIIRKFHINFVLFHNICKKSIILSWMERTFWFSGKLSVLSQSENDFLITLSSLVISTKIVGNQQIDNTFCCPFISLSLSVYLIEKSLSLPVDEFFSVIGTQSKEDNLPHLPCSLSFAIFLSLISLTSITPCTYTNKSFVFVVGSEKQWRWIEFFF